MVVLKRIKASTLMETLVATVLIVIIFMVASMLLNTIFSNNIKGRNNHITEHLQQLKYEYIHMKIKPPYIADYKGWEISINTEVIDGMNQVLFLAENKETEKTISQTLINEK